MPQPPRRNARWPRISIHTAALLPLAMLTWLFLRDQLGPAPISTLIRQLGRYALLLLLLSLVPTAIRVITGVSFPPYTRRALGLYAFLYTSLHLLAFAGLDYRFNLPLIATAILQSRREIVGLAAFLILALLALTSVPSLMSILGRRWKALHRLVYVAAALVVLHYTWNYKESRTWPTLAAVALFVLLAARLPLIAALLNRQKRP